MTELRTFENPKFGAIRVIVIDEMPWFVGTDFCKALGYSNENRALTNADKADRMLWERNDIPAIVDVNGRPRNHTLINVNGCVTLMNICTFTTVKPFSDWFYKIVSSLRICPPSVPKKRKRVPKSEQAAVNVTKAPEMHPETKNDFTREELLKAAQIVATCKNDRLPCVLSVLRQAGIQVDDAAPKAENKKNPKNKKAEPVPQKKRAVTNAKAERAVILMQRAIDTYGLNQFRIGEIVGIHRTTINCILNGKDVPQPKTAEQIIESLTRTFPEIAFA